MSESLRSNLIFTMHEEINSKGLPDHLTPQADHVVTARKVMESIVETSSPEKNAKIKNERILTLSAAMCVMQWKVDNEA
ncbi:hypothetical protein A7D16_16285 [Xanthomonas nasturtii]|uniref:Uncharacterized protein n=1 Tax=Xanthomonas nasturtii TaxID=1843581 RepID=A0A3E1KK03_9XANT|nr:hypothetical protein A7D16_16285 [Xanthomonas nasturtii]RFF39034.1 hypothetical protein DZD52_10610 [Xanthomonas nasturtii]